MHHCLVITAYKDLDQIQRLICHTPLEWGIYIHIDKKSSISVANINKRAIVLKRYSINWDSVNHLRAFLDLLKIAFDSDENYDYFHLITGQDYFSTNPLSFDQLIEKGKSYIEIHACPRPGWWGGGYDILRYRSLATDHEVQRKKIWKAIEILYYNIQKIFHLQKGLPTYPIFCGSVYCSLFRDAVSTIFESPITQDLLSRLSNSKLAEEIFFQTVLMNSPFKDSIINNNMRYIDWSVPTPPKFLSEDDYESIRSSSTLFCRKVDSTISAHLIDLLQV